MGNANKIDLTGQQLAVYPEWLEGRTEIEELWLDSNQLAILPDSIGQ
jgi:hypothetical protein